MAALPWGRSNMAAQRLEESDGSKIYTSYSLSLILHLFIFAIGYNFFKEKSKSSGKGKGVKCKRCGHVCNIKRELINHKKEHRVAHTQRSSTISEEENQPSTSYQPHPRGGPTLNIISAVAERITSDWSFCYMQEMSRGDPDPWGDDERLRDTFLANKNFILSKGDKVL
ncbi:uncharacterized protein LOC134261661 [Saccostrea cucullata]|uniref:uncharacterized protein LOC134261661 n=1 Tax=Saccostrea cuccullata TaxID=36930 RepID=UPI002ED0F78D